MNISGIYMRNTVIPMINKDEMEWVIRILSQLEKGHVDRPEWHYTECKKIVERMKLIIEKDQGGKND
jgi:hypothetical protein